MVSVTAVCCTVMVMDIGSIFWTLLLSITYGYCLYFMTWYRVHDVIMLVYCGYSYRRFNAFYEMAQNGYKSFAYFSKPLINNAQYLEAFERYDIDTAYRRFRISLISKLKSLSYSSLKQSLILIVIGMIFFPIPLLGYGVVAGYCLIRLTYMFVAAYGISTGLRIITNDFIWSACQYAYGTNRTQELLKRQPYATAEEEAATSKKSLLHHIAVLNRILWGNGNWSRTLIIWLLCLVPLAFMPTYTNNQVVSEIFGIISLIYVLFPAGYLVYKCQIMDFTDTSPQAVTSDEVRNTSNN